MLVSVLSINSGQHRDDEAVTEGRGTSAARCCSFVLGSYSAIVIKDSSQAQPEVDRRCLGAWFCRQRGPASPVRARRRVTAAASLPPLGLSASLRVVPVATHKLDWHSSTLRAQGQLAALNATTSVGAELSARARVSSRSRQWAQQHPAAGRHGGLGCRDSDDLSASLLVAVATLGTAATCAGLDGTVV